MKPRGLPPGTTHGRLLCASFASHSGALVATGGRRSDEATSKGVAVWDTLADRTAPVAHDGEAFGRSTMPLEYCAMTWAPQRLFCGTKARARLLSCEAEEKGLHPLARKI